MTAQSAVIPIAALYSLVGRPHHDRRHREYGRRRKMGLTEWKGGAECLRYARVMLGCKLDDVSEKSGVFRHAIARLESAERGGRTTSVRVGTVNTSLFAARVGNWQRKIPILARSKANEHFKIQGHSD